jgi:hypothetical protein
MPIYDLRSHLFRIPGLYTEGCPGKMSFTYVPTWKIAELEAKVRELRSPANRSGQGVAKTEGERLAEAEELEEKLKTCRRGVTVSDMCEVRLAQGNAVLRGNVLKADDLPTDLLGWGTLKGCYVYYRQTSSRSQTFKTRKMVSDFNADAKSLTMEERSQRERERERERESSAELERSKKSTNLGINDTDLATKGAGRSGISDIDVVYLLVSEVPFKVLENDDEHVFLRRLPAVPRAHAKLADRVYPFVGEELVLSKAAALQMQVRGTQLLSAIRNESEDAQSIATTLIAGSSAEEDPDPDPTIPQSVNDTEKGWTMLGACKKGDIVSMHDFTFCKCLMLSVVKKVTRHGGYKWGPLLPQAKLDITVPTPLAATDLKETLRRDERLQPQKNMAQTRLNRSNIHIIPVNLAEFFSAALLSTDAASSELAGSATLAASSAAMLAEPLHLALCDVSELNAEDADSALQEMGIKAVIDCGSATRLIPTPLGGANKGRPVPLSVGCGVAPWQLSQGKDSHSLQDVAYTHLPFEDLQASDVGQASSLFQEMLDFILKEVKKCVSICTFVLVNPDVLVQKYKC